MSVERLVSILADEADLTAREIADLLWLALRIQPEVETQPEQKPETQTVRQEESIDDTVIEAPLPVTSSKPTANISTPISQSADVLPTNALPIWIPDPPILSNTLSLIRALRPLLKQVEVGISNKLDETATVEQIAQTQIWIPILKPETEPWFEAVLIIDRSISMNLWRRLTDDIALMLKRYGAFRDLRIFDLEQVGSEVILRFSEPNATRTYSEDSVSNSSEDNFSEYSGQENSPHNQSKQRFYHDPRELIEPNGRRIILILSDCIESYWWDGKLNKIIQLWSESMPTAIWQMLPEWMWERTGLGQGDYVAIRNTIPGAINTQLQTEILGLEEPKNINSRVVVPVITSEAEDLRRWSRMLGGDRREVTAGFLLPQYGKQVPKAESIQDMASERLHNRQYESLNRDLLDSEGSANSLSSWGDKGGQSQLEDSEDTNSDAQLSENESPLNPPNLGDLDSTSPHNLGDKGGQSQELATRETSTTVEQPYNEAIADAVQERLQEWRLLSSPRARRLIMLLAASPVITLPVMRLIRASMLSDNFSPLPIAEVFLSGLFKKIPNQENRDPEEIQYDFMTGVREELLKFLPPVEVIEVINKISFYVAQRLNYTSLRDFLGVLTNPETENPEQQGLKSFARVTANILERLGGDYKSFARELRQGAGEIPTDNQLPANFPQLQTFEYEFGEITEILERFEFETALYYALDPQPIIAKGVAVIRFEEEDDDGNITNKTVQVTPNDLEWFEFETEQRPMGVEIGYNASYYFGRWERERTRIDWYVWEYPVGDTNTSDYEIEGGTLIKNFDSLKVYNREEPFEEAFIHRSRRATWGYTEPLNSETSLGRWTRQQTEKLRERLLVAYPSFVSLEMFIQEEFGRNLGEISANTNLRRTVFDLVQYFESRGQLGELWAKFAGGINLEMISIPGGTFLMGAPEDEPESLNSERPQHAVTLKPFYMSRYAVTQAQWRIVAGYPQIERELNPDPSRFKGDNRPVERVNWYDATEFCKRLSAHTGRKYKLPSEAQWEYACRAGTTTPFYFGETITTDLANYRGTSTYNGSPEGEYRGQTTDVGSFPANAWGLYDMHGNVWEWCEDDWHPNYKGAPDDGTAWIDIDQDRTDTEVGLRGGSWSGYPTFCRSAYRDGLIPRGFISDLVGFRIVCAFQDSS